MKPHLPKPSTPAMNDPAPQTLIRKVVDACADCDTCRFLMNDDCLFFPALYRLVDNEAKTGRPSSDHELRQLVECCTLCGLCPCPNIRTEVMRAKSAFVDQSGMSLKNRLLVDVQRFGQACGMIPSLAHAALNTRSAKRIAKRLVGIHPDRRLPVPSKESFFAWAKRKGLGDHPVNSRGVAYFSGCTAGYLFPEVAKAAVTVLQRCNISVYVPPQHCCGMPSLVEGDMRTTRQRAGSNVDSILVARRLGYDPVCSCPTCGFLMKVLLKEGACYSDSYQRSVGADGTEIKIPDGTGNGGYIHLNKALYGKVLKDDGLFNDLDPLDRMAVADGLSDLGAYLLLLLNEQRLNLRLRTYRRRVVYFAPCHQREQEIGSPYLSLLPLVPGLRVERVGGAMDCCGMGGSLGLKKEFHPASIAIGAALMEKIKALAPQSVITDCLSCRLQFEHLLPYPVFHPLEVLAAASGSV